MKTLHVESRSGSYPVILADDVLAQIGCHLQMLGFGPADRVAIITDDNVATMPVAEALRAGLSAAEINYFELVVAAGDASKSLATAAILYDELLDAGMRRKDLIIALGGGVIGDLAGFVAATFLRGIRFVQIPTTLLSHDSSIGGKVGVNLPQGKNLVGSFYPPQAVLFHLPALTTLPLRQWQNGMAEVIKHGVIGSPELFERLEAHPLTACPEPAILEVILAKAMQVKIDVVNADEREQGRRQILNVGHTIGHAIEQRSQYALGHGEAIAIGLVLEAELAVRRGLLERSVAHRIKAVLEAHQLPTQPPKDDFAAISSLIGVDKKHHSDAWTMALPARVGDVVLVTDISHGEVGTVYNAAMGRFDE